MPFRTDSRRARVGRLHDHATHRIHRPAARTRHGHHGDRPHARLRACGRDDFRPEDLAQTTAAIFFTRWITHFCAPVFMFCAGLGAVVPARARRHGAPSLSRFLWTRGLWLIVLEFTLVRLGFFFNLKYERRLLLVFWALGMSMIALALLVRLPFRVLLGVSVAMIALHNLTDGVPAARFGSFAWLWNVLHQPGLLDAGRRAGRRRLSARAVDRRDGRRVLPRRACTAAG